VRIQKITLGLFLLAFCSGVFANEKVISISSKASYYDEKIIPSNIKTECSELGQQFSEATKRYLEAEKWQVNFVDNAGKATKGTSIKLQITNAVSAGNAFMGHSKSVAILAELYKDGKLIDTYTASRDSGGGFAGGFKGSCSVLHRCVNTLGSDVAKWLKKNNI